jgi:hypothetical protein
MRTCKKLFLNEEASNKADALVGKLFDAKARQQAKYEEVAGRPEREATAVRPKQEAIQGLEELLVAALEPHTIEDNEAAAEEASMFLEDPHLQDYLDKNDLEVTPEDPASIQAALDYVRGDQAALKNSFRSN